MINSVFLNIAVPFIFNRIIEFKDSVDWDKVESDLDKYVREFLPGTWFDDAAAKIAKDVFHKIRTSFIDEASLKRLIKILLNGKFEDAMKLVRDTVLSNIGMYAATDSDEKVMHIFANLGRESKPASSDEMMLV